MSISFSLIFSLFISIFLFSKFINPQDNFNSVELNWLNLATSQLKLILERNGISNLPKESLNILPPKYMIDLYHKQVKEDFLPTSDHQINQVRCIMGKIRRESMNFNLSSLSPGDNISRAEVHMFRKKSRHGKLPRIKFFQSHHRTRNYLPKKYVSKTSILPSTRGWQRLDITKLLKASFRKWELVGLSMESLIPEFGTGREVYHNVGLDELIRLTYKPFLVIFSTTSESMSKFPFLENLPLFKLDEKGIPGDYNWDKEGRKRSESNQIPNLNDYHFSRINEKRIGDNNELENSLYPILSLPKETNHVGRTLNETVENENEISGTDQFQPTPLQGIHQVQVLRRTFLGNNQSISNHFLTYFPSIHNSRDESSDEVVSTDYSSVKVKTWTPSEEIHNTVLPFDNTWSTLRRTYSTNQKFRKKKNKKSRRRSRENSRIKISKDFDNEKIGMIPLESEVSSERSTSDSNPSEHYCVVQNLSIPLDYDWTEQIIAPATFPINYCSGTCSPFSNSSEGREMNAWVVGSILWPMKSSNPSSATSCCSPEKLNSLSLLYIDKFESIVLRSYPNATVLACSCR